MLNIFDVRALRRSTALYSFSPEQVQAFLDILDVFTPPQEILAA